jgi:hydroxymethylpyrimidine pyrophosphatase-like HAD family hydrolase
MAEEERAVLALEDQSSDAVGGGATVSATAATQVLTVGGDSVALDHLGPIVVNLDGTLTRIANWQEMSEREQAVARRRVAKRNKERMADLESRPPPPRPRVAACAIDVDGTLFTSGGLVQERTAAVLLQARAAGVLPIICTGKIPGPWQAPINALDLRAPAIFLQGALVQDAAGATVLERTLPASALRGALLITGALEREHGAAQACCLACCGGEYLCATASPLARETPHGLLAHGEPEPRPVCSSGGAASLAEALGLEGGAQEARPVHKLVVCLGAELVGTEGAAAAFLARLRGSLGEGAELLSYAHTAQIVEVVPKGVSKAAALRELLPKLGLGPEQLLAIGDGSNDVSMLSLAGIGVAVRNASDDAKQAADFVRNRRPPRQRSSNPPAHRQLTGMPRMAGFGCHQRRGRGGGRAGALRASVRADGGPPPPLTWGWLRGGSGGAPDSGRCLYGSLGNGYAVSVWVH